MEILELEMRARAIKAMLKAQDELDKAEKLRAHMKSRPGAAHAQMSCAQHDGASSSGTQQHAAAGGGARPRTKKKVVIRKVLKKKPKAGDSGVGKERQLAKDLLEEATTSTSGQLQYMRK